MTRATHRSTDEASERIFADLYRTLRTAESDSLVGSYHGEDGSGDLSLMRKVAKAVAFADFITFVKTRVIPDGMPPMKLTTLEMEALRGGSDSSHQFFETAESFLKAVEARLLGS